MPNIFISYRRADSGDIAGRVNEHLIGAFGADAVFKDSEDIPPGADFRGVLRREVAKSDVMLVLIGQKWLTITDAAGKRRLDDLNDWVRFEVESGLQMGTRVIPVLLNGTSIPNAGDLPDTLRELAYKNAISVRNDPDFSGDMRRLITSLEAGKTIPARENKFVKLLRDPAVQALIGIAGIIITVLFAVLSSGGNNPPPTPTSSAPLATPRTPVFEPNRDLDIRSGAGSGFSRINILPANTGVDIMGVSDDRLWYQILLADGTTGWILASESGGRFNGNQAVLRVIIPTATPTGLPTDAPTATDLPTNTPQPSDTPPPPTATDTPTVTPLPTDAPPATNTPAITGAFPCSATVTNPDSAATVITVIYSEASTASERQSSSRVGEIVTLQRVTVDNNSIRWYLAYSSSGKRLGWITERFVILSATCPS
jgi:hypothetical protein